MGNAVCGVSTLLPENYPPARRFLRQVTTAGIDDEELRSSTLREKKKIHVMSYNLLADHLTCPGYFTYASPAVLDFSFRGPRIMEEIASS